MECFNCGARLSDSDFCNACGVDVKKYKEIMFTANKWYNDGLERAKVRDLSGAVSSLKKCLKLNKNHIDARNLLGLIYFEIGETVAGLSEWVISKNIRPEKNIADEFLERIQSNQGRLDTLTTTIKKYNKALELSKLESNDLAVIQLKKVLSLNPKYVQAHNLLALLLIEKGEYEKAKKELERVLTIDCGNLETLRYLKEVENILYPADENGKVKKKNKNKKTSEEASRTYKEGNEVIIQPLNNKESHGINIIIQIAIGFVIGLCATYFLIVPDKIDKTKNENKEEIAKYIEALNKFNVEVSDKDKRIAELEQNNVELKSSLEDYEGNNGTIDANNYLLSAAMAYMSGQDSTVVENSLNLIGNDYLDASASYEYKTLYEYLLSQIGDSVANNYYESGLNAFNQMDYATAIKDLTKAYTYNPNSSEALYYLALSYYESGDVSKAEEKLNDLVAQFPSGEMFDKAKQKLEEIAAQN